MKLEHSPLVWMRSHFRMTLAAPFPIELRPFPSLGDADILSTWTDALPVNSAIKNLLIMTGFYLCCTN